MRKIIVCVFLSLFISGCAPKPNELQATGYYSNGAKFAYCKNPQLFDRKFIDYVNSKYSPSLNSKVSSISEIDSENNNGYAVQLPLRCNGVFNMEDGGFYKFNVVVSITQAKSLNIDSLILNRDKDRESIERNKFAESFSMPSIQYCNDLMRRVRETYGKAPHCVPVIKNSINLTENAGLVGLSDELSGRNIYYYMNIIPNQLNGDYIYNERELNSLITLIKYQNKGI